MAHEPETVIATVVHTKSKILTDMELPTNVPIKKLKTKMLDVLKNIHEGIFMNWSECELVYSSHLLGNDETLSSAGIFEGAYLYIIGNIYN